MKISIKKILLIVTPIIIVAGLATLVWFNINIGINKSFLLVRTYQQYNRLFNASVCNQAYIYLSEHAKSQHSFDEYKSKCSKKTTIAIDSSVRDVIFENPTTAKLIVGRQATVKGTDVKSNQILTWVFENSKWKRDWPD